MLGEAKSSCIANDHNATRAVKGLDTPYELNVFSLILMTIVFSGFLPKVSKLRMKTHTIWKQ